MSINASLIIQILVFGILVWFTVKFVWPPLSAALDERAQKISESLRSADQAKLALQEADQKVHEEMARVKVESQARLNQAELRASSIIDNAHKQAEEKAKLILAQANEEITRQVELIREELRQKVAVLVIQGVEQILTREVNAQVHSDILRQLPKHL
ncbi:MAG: F0F1 ATP synthase subunit B [Gammaproteobacteria bacterium]|nr:F0F1 ATP synthase subunit B [Gammaproteobacteria bacterium]